MTGAGAVEAGADRAHGYLEGVGGLRLHYRVCEVPAPRAGLLVVHGLGEHSGRYEELAAALGRAGLSVFAHDQRGHGRSDGRRGHVGVFGRFLQDLDRFRREVLGLLPPGTPLFLLGHSLGGLVVIRYLQEYDPGIRGAVLSAPWLATAFPVSRWKVALGERLAGLLPALPLPGGVPERLLSRDPEVVRRYREDPLVHRRVTPGLYREVRRAQATALGRPEAVRRPALFLLPGADALADTGVGEEFARRIPGDDVTVRLYPGAYHEVLNEVGREEVHREVAAWIGARLS